MALEDERLASAEGGSGRGKRGRRSEISGRGRRRLSWRRSRTTAMERREREGVDGFGILLDFKFRLIGR